MTSNSFTTTVITAAEGHKLTQAGDVDLMDRFFAVRIALGAGDSADNYREITDDEVAAYEAEREAVITAAREAEAAKAADNAQ